MNETPEPSRHAQQRARDTRPRETAAQHPKAQRRRGEAAARRDAAARDAEARGESESRRQEAEAGRRAEREERAAAREAGAIGGVAGDEDLDPARRPVLESGGGEAEGFEESEAFLIEHASHGDQQSAHAVLHDRGRVEERAMGESVAEANCARSSGLDPEGPAGGG